MSVKINSLELENVKRIRAVKIEPSASGLTVIGGKNNQGKTSVLDSIAWALGGDRFRPSSAVREGSVIPPYLRIELSNGLIVERKGKNSDLKVIDPAGNKSGQQLLNEFISAFALDLPKFMNANNHEKADTLLQIIGVGDRLYELERIEREVYNNRHAIGQIADSKRKHASEMPFYNDVPDELISASELIKQQQDILARNGENARKRLECDRYNRELAEAQIAFDAAQTRLREAEQNAVIARTSAENLLDESTAELEKNIADIELINNKIRTNLEKEKAEEDAKDYNNKYDELTASLNDIRKQKYDLLHNVELPLDNLSVEDGELTYNGFKWDNMSGSDQLRVAAAIVRKLNPDCGFVLLDKLEQMDIDTLNSFGEWLEQEGLQAIATRVSTGDECSIIIEDGYSKKDDVVTTGGVF
ncbi:MAG: AAA family ATPase [Clostridia bacterium]|nr:AAA family ATPase [Clostridia bacterium]